MAGSAMTFEYDDGYGVSGGRGGVRKVIASWTSDDTAGTASGVTRRIVGELVKIQTDPGSVAPTDNWDVTITDEEGVNVVANCQNAALLIARDTANTEETYLHLLNVDGTPVGFALYPVVCDALTISIANAGNSKTGQIILYYKTG